jgi:MFS family permease
MPRRYAAIVAIFIIIEATEIFETVMMYTAVPKLMGVFKLDVAGISWAITVFLLMGTAVAPIAGRLGDLYGRRRVLLILLGISALGSVVSVAFGTFDGILVGRALQGTSAALFPLLAGIAREVVPAPRVPVLVSITTGTASLAGAVAGLLAGVLLDLGDWRFIFLCSGALAVFALLAALGLPRSVVVPVRHGRFDVLGAILLAPAVGTVLIGLDNVRTGGFTVSVYGPIIGGLAVLACWVVWELRVKNPIFNLRLFRERALVLALLVVGLIGLGVFNASALILPILMQSPRNLPVGLGLTPTAYGFYGFIVGGLGFLASPLGGRLASKSGAKLSLTLGIGMTILAFGGLLFAVHNLPLAVAAMLFVGLGITFVLLGLPNLIVETVLPQNTGEAIGIVFTVGRTLFSAVGTAVIGFILASSVVPGTTAPTLTAWNAVILFVGVTALLALVVTSFIRKAVPMSRRGDVVEALAEAREQDPLMVSEKGTP